MAKIRHSKKRSLEGGIRNGFGLWLSSGKKIILYYQNGGERVSCFVCLFCVHARRKKLQPAYHFPQFQQGFLNYLWLQTLHND